MEKNVSCYPVHTEDWRERFVFLFFTAGGCVSKYIEEYSKLFRCKQRKGLPTFCLCPAIFSWWDRKGRRMTATIYPSSPFSQPGTLLRALCTVIQLVSPTASEDIISPSYSNLPKVHKLVSGAAGIKTQVGVIIKQSWSEHCALEGHLHVWLCINSNRPQILLFMKLKVDKRS